MLSLTLLKYIFIVLCSSYVFKKLLNIRIHALYIAPDCACAITLAVITIKLSEHIFWSIFITIFLFCFINRFIYKLPFNISLVSGIISFGLAHLASVFAVLVTLLLMALPPLRVLPHQTADYAMELTIDFLLLAIAWIPFQFGQLKNGVPYLQQNKGAWFDVIVSLIILLSTSLLRIYPEHRTILPFYLLILAEGGFCLIIWWRQKIIGRYNERIQRKKLEDAEAIIQKSLAEQSVLRQDNSAMAKFLHEQSKMLTAINTTVKELLQAAEFQNESQKQKVEDFMQYVTAFSGMYSQDLFSYSNQVIPPRELGLPGVDGMVRQMQLKAFQAGIDFDFSFSENVKASICDTVSEVDLTRLIGDLVQNAIIAVGDANTKRIYVYLSPVDSGFCLDVMDSGCPFPAEVLAKLGKEQVTSYAESGGSGFGMMTVFNILRKNTASFILTEYPPGRAFSKKISICFDGRNRVIIEKHPLM